MEVAPSRELINPSGELSLPEGFNQRRYPSSLQTLSLSGNFFHSIPKNNYNSWLYQTNFHRCKNVAPIPEHFNSIHTTTAERAAMIASTLRPYAPLPTSSRSYVSSNTSSSPQTSESSGSIDDEKELLEQLEKELANSIENEDIIKADPLSGYKFFDSHPTPVRTEKSLNPLTFSQDSLAIHRPDFILQFDHPTSKIVSSPRYIAKSPVPPSPEISKDTDTTTSTEESFPSLQQRAPLKEPVAPPLPQPKKSVSQKKTRLTKSATSSETETNVKKEISINVVSTKTKSDTKKNKSLPKKTPTPKRRSTRSKQKQILDDPTPQTQSDKPAQVQYASSPTEHCSYDETPEEALRLLKEGEGSVKSSRNSSLSSSGTSSSASLSTHSTPSSTKSHPKIISPKAHLLHATSSLFPFSSDSAEPMGSISLQSEPVLPRSLSLVNTSESPTPTPSTSTKVRAPLHPFRLLSTKPPHSISTSISASPPKGKSEKPSTIFTSQMEQKPIQSTTSHEKALSVLDQKLDTPDFSDLLSETLRIPVQLRTLFSENSYNSHKVCQEILENDVSLASSSAAITRLRNSWDALIVSLQSDFRSAMQHSLNTSNSSSEQKMPRSPNHLFSLLQSTLVDSHPLKKKEHLSPPQAWSLFFNVFIEEKLIQKFKNAVSQSTHQSASH